jgi:hypothetical protein
MFVSVSTNATATQINGVERRTSGFLCMPPILHPMDNTITGPFCDAVRLKALIEELAQPMACVADIVYHLVVIPNDSALTSTRIQFRTIADQWRNRWLRNLPIT